MEGSPSYTQSPTNISGGEFINHDIKVSAPRVSHRYTKSKSYSGHKKYISKVEYESGFENITLESLHNIVSTKLGCIKSLINEDTIDIVRTQYLDIYTKYNMTYASIIPSYTDAVKSENTDIMEIMMTFYRKIEQHCILNNMDWIVSELEKTLTTMDDDYKYIQQYRNCKNISSFIEKIDYLECENCHVQCYHNVYSSELKCPHCGRVKVVDCVPTSEQIPTDCTNNQNQNSTYDINRRFIKIINEVLAKTQIDLPRTLFDELQSKSQLERIPKKEYITCKNIRRWLKELNCGSKYNHLIPKIHKVMTSIPPPELDEKEMNLLYNNYIKVINTFFIIKESSSKNSLYCRYFIYKLVSIFIKDKPKREAIMDRIHDQEEDTLKKNDELWMKICQRIPELNNLYRPTNTYKYQ